MMHYVYVLINEAGTVEYVGQTVNPKTRMSTHKCKPSGNHGQFHNRNDISMEIVKEFGTEREALDYEGQLKLNLGFEWTERTAGMKGDKAAGGRIGGKIVGRKHVESGHWASVQRKGARKIKELYSQPVLAYRKDTGELVGEFPSQIEAARGLGLNGGAISMVLSGKIKQTGGYTFKRK